MCAHPLLRLLGDPARPLHVLGLMSGTSADGLDCALVRLEGQGLDTRVLEVRARTYPYDAAQRARILSLMRPETTVQQICEGSFWLGEVFAGLALRFLSELGVAPDAVDLCGSHGQTVWHQPPSQCRDGQVPSTLQLGEPAVLAARTGLVTVADFRVADVALGGEGAPLVPFCDFLLCRRPGQVRALQNIGGIANVTLVGEDLASLCAFDNGPGNMIIDALAELATGGAQRCDQDGALSAGGVVQPDLLAALLDDPYLRQAPPKSTGRERYGVATAHAFAARHADRRPVDLLATAVELTAQAIALSLRGRRLDEVLVSGGGVHNRTLMARLSALLAPLPVHRFAEGAIDADAKEAVAFAVLAAQALRGQPANVPSVTGARLPAVLGKLCLPP